MKTTLSIGVLFCVSAALLFGRPPDAPPVTDPAVVAQHYREILSQPQYHEPIEDNAGDWLKSELSRWFTRLGAEFGNVQYAQQMPRFASLLMTALVILSMIGLVYTMVRVIRRKQDWLEPDAAANGGPARFRPPEFYEEELRRATARGDWSGAWLATWRQFLSRLEQGRLVEPDRSRTNREYLAQLRERALPAPALALLAGMVDAYDNFIYGRRPIAQSDWTAFHQQANEAALLLHLQERPGPAAAT